MVENKEQDGDEEHAPEPFGGEEALELARQGKDAWNTWAEENPGRKVNFIEVNFTAEENKDISFQGFTFPGEVFFSRAKFQSIFFSGAVFKGEANFIETTFRQGVWFTEAAFKGMAYFTTASFDDVAGFSRATFEGNALFTGSMFSGVLDLHGSHFRTVPDFRGTDFKKHLTLNRMEVDFRLPTTDIDADMYRRIKELAVAARDHDRAQMFFAYELMAKRGHETRGLALVPNYLYGWFGGFGRSLRRPSAWLIGVWFGFGVLYRGLASKDSSHLLDGLLFSSAQLFPFLGASKGALGDAKAALFGNAALEAGVNALGMLEGGLGILFLFLIGLALRNRFRI